MSEQEFNKIFSQRLRYYLEKNNMTQKELADRLGVGTTSVYNWCNAVKSPRMKYVDKMCEIFGCTRVDLIKSEESDGYYLNPETAAIAQQIFDDPELRLLFDAAKDAKPEDLQLVHNMLKALKRKENPESDDPA